MKERYPVAYEEVDGGWLCTSEEFGVIDFLIDSKDEDYVYKKIVEILADQLIVDVSERWILRAPYEEKDTSFDLTDTKGIFIIRCEDLRDAYKTKLKVER